MTQFYPRHFIFFLSIFHFIIIIIMFLFEGYMEISGKNQVRRFRSDSSMTGVSR